MRRLLVCQQQIYVTLIIRERNISSGKALGELSEEQIKKLDEIGMRWQSQADLIWEEGFEHAKAYFEETGAADAPFVYVAHDGYKLGLFLSKCREKYAKGRLSEERILRLNSINMVWNKSRKNDWDTCFEHAKAYYEEHSDLNIPPDYKADGIWLNKWLNEQRQIMLGKRKGKALTDEQIERLKSISFTGETPREIHWKTMLEAAEKFYKENGFSAKIPNDLVVDGTSLKTWVTNEQAISEGKLSNPRTREQIEKLKKIGIVKAKNSMDKRWLENLEKLKIFIRENGRMPEYKDDISLRKWAAKQINSYENGVLSKKQYGMLIAIGFRLDEKKSVLRMFRMKMELCCEQKIYLNKTIKMRKPKWTSI